jgi:hypothetical protein
MFHLESFEEIVVFLKFWHSLVKIIELKDSRFDDSQTRGHR